MRKGKKYIAAACSILLAAGLLTACGSPAGTYVKGLDALGQIQAVTRESDSGTRASFDDLTGTGTESGKLTEVGTTQEVLKEVGSSPSALGYLTSDAVDDSVKVLTVDGKNITDEKYPLIRQFYLVSQNNLSDLGKEFITYVTGKGQETVAKSLEAAFKPVTFLSLQPAGKLMIGGSSSEAPIMEKLAEEYMTENPKADITVETTDSGSGINGVLEGGYDLGMSSRKPKEYELSLLNFTPVAKDRIAVVAEKGNPLENITTAQLAAIYTGELTDWEDLNEKAGGNKQ